MATIRVHFDGKVFVPDEPVDLPVGTSGETSVSTETQAGSRATPSVEDRPLLKLIEIAQRFPDSELPTDGAAQHDHYLYGKPKR